MFPIFGKLTFYDSGVIFVFISEQSEWHTADDKQPHKPCDKQPHLTNHGSQMFEYFGNAVGLNHGHTTFSVNF